MSKDHLEKASRFLSYALRHKPGEAGIQLDHNGWTTVPLMLAALKKNGLHLSLEQLQHLVATNNKKRFEFSEDATKIRASQGHSVKIDLALKPSVPPNVLYHGTAKRSLDEILASGIKRISRNHIHLSPDVDTARNVGSRHGVPVIIEIDSKKMHDEGHIFYKSANGVWLTETTITPNFFLSIK